MRKRPDWCMRELQPLAHSKPAGIEPIAVAKDRKSPVKASKVCCLFSCLTSLIFPLPLFCIFVGILGAFPEITLAQAQHSVVQEFAAYETALNEAAQRTLSDLSTASQGRTKVVTERSSWDHTHEPDEDLIREFAQKYWGGHEANLRAAINRVDKLRPVLTPILKHEGIPPDLLAIVLVESAGHTNALSSRRALGLWQLIPGTARHYGLLVSPQVDDREDPHKATRAAARYLHHLYAHFGNWPLALAAYNAGEETVDAAITRSGASDFWIPDTRRRMPLETREYVPAVLAAEKLLERVTFSNGEGHVKQDGSAPLIFAEIKSPAN